MSNEAAERLRRRFGQQRLVKADKHGTETASDVLDLALAHERSAGAGPLDVERLLASWIRHMKRRHPNDDYEDPTYECAEHTAAEYARLSSEPPVGEEPT